MKKILLIRSNPVNPDPPVEKMGNTLLELGYSVDIVGWDRGKSYKIREEGVEFQHGKVKVIRFGIPAEFGAGFKGNLKPLYKFQIALKKWLERNGSQYDLIHAFDFDTAYVSSNYAQRHKIPFIYHVLDYYVDSHNLKLEFIKKIVRGKENRIISEADATIICTEKRKEQIKGSKPQRIEIIHNTPDSSIMPEENIFCFEENRRTRIVYVGILAGTRLLLELAEVVKENLELELHIGGFGQLEDTFKMYSTECENIKFYGKLPYSQTLALERACDIMIAAYDPAVKNHRFAAPNKFYESLMIGKPIIMAKDTGFDDVIVNNDIGVVIDFSKEGVDFGIKSMRERKEEWKEMGNRANELYRNHYSWSIMKGRICKLYSDLIGK